MKVKLLFNVIRIDEVFCEVFDLKKVNEEKLEKFEVVVIELERKFSQVFEEKNIM